MQLTPLESCVVEDALKLLVIECNLKLRYTEDKFMTSQKQLAEQLLLKIKPQIK